MKPPSDSGKTNPKQTRFDERSEASPILSRRSLGEGGQTQFQKDDPISKQWGRPFDCAQDRRGAKYEVFQF